MAGRYIVRFNAYAMAGAHRAALAVRLSQQGARWVERDNAAMAFPTDFGVVDFGGTLQELQASSS